ncbi:MAG: extracellular solute-binding protein [Clostridiales bacterium]|jgi:multiple sugar transport system substrate-binding protein|nr:extracellular solute-binding protein [Clostridiales bacterium]
MKRIFSAVIFAAVFLSLMLASCSNKYGLDSSKPVTVYVWHYYNGALMKAFDALVKEFNEEVGVNEGIIVESLSFGSLSELENAVISSAKKEAGSAQMPDIFATYADTALKVEELNLLANLDEYFSDEEQAQYHDSFISEGRIGKNGELRIIPVAKTPEILLINETDWLPFADANNLTYGDLETAEGLSRVSELYYNWSGGKAFFGRDVIANMFIIASKQFGVEILGQENGKAKIEINRDIMKKIWDFYYVPYISGWFYSYGKFRSDDTRAGDILAYVGATSSAAYFPAEVAVSGSSYPINFKALPAPLLSGGSKVIVQQGAGMAVTKSDEQREYASVVFLKWFTDVKNNIGFSALSGYMPVKKEVASYAAFSENLEQNGISINPIANEALKVVFDEAADSEFYTVKAFPGSAEARVVLENNLRGKADSDRAEVISLIEGGLAEKDAVALFSSEEKFNEWLEEFTKELNEAVE